MPDKRKDHGLADSFLAPSTRPGGTQAEYACLWKLGRPAATKGGQPTPPFERPLLGRSLNPMRILWNTVGFSSLAAGLAGAVLPLLPATPFFILAAYAFSRGSPKVESWLLGHPRWGPVILDWRRERAISKKAKIVSLAAICATPLLSLILGFAWTVVAAQTAILAAVGVFIVTRRSPADF